MNNISKVIFALAMTLCIVSCQKQDKELLNNCEDSNLYNMLCLDVNPVSYGDFITDSTRVGGRLDEDRGLIVFDPNVVNIENHFNYCNDTLSSDSIRVVASLKYNLTQEVASFQEIDIQFYYNEAVSNLTSNDDGILYYKDYRPFYNILKNKSWDTHDWFACTKVNISIPDAALPWGSGEINNLNSNIFGLDWENFKISSCEFDTNTQQIDFSANFDVSIKILSCGYYEFFRFENAELHALLNPVVPPTIDIDID